MTGRVLVLLLLAASIAGPGQRDESDRTALLVSEWMAAVRAHRPGTVDQPLLQVAGMPPADLNAVGRALGPALERICPERPGAACSEERNDLLRRGALVHTDIALLLPARAAEYLETPENPAFIIDTAGRVRVAQRRQPQGAVHTIDGGYVRTSVGTAHWSMARSLLGAIRPRSRSDGFVRLWYRAVAARFASAGLFGGAQHALDRGLELLPHDPVLLFYAGAMHETLASARFQSVARSLIARQQRFPSPRDELRDAEKLLGASVKAEGPVEAHLRYARVRGLLGRHEDAVARLRRVAPQLDARRLQYFAALFLGSEEDALGHVGAARDAFERAAALYPTAQSPVLALGALFRRAGDRKAVLEALSRLEALPADRADREDPWTDYYRSFAFDADQQLAAVRAWVDREPR